MNHSEILKKVQNFITSFGDTELWETVQTYQSLNAHDDIVNEMNNLVNEGIHIHSTTGNYQLAVSKIEESIKLFPCAFAFLRRSGIHWKEGNFQDSFSDACSALLLDKDNFPVTYWLAANSLQKLTDNSAKTNMEDEKKIFDIILLILTEGKKRNDEHSIKMLPEIKMRTIILSQR